MTSLQRDPRQVPVNALYTNITDCRSTIFTATGGVVTWTGQAAHLYNNNLSSVGGALFRDMGKTVYLPDPTVPASVGSQSTIMRKVQLVTGYYGTGAPATNGISGSPGSTTEYYTGYIKLGGQTYGGGGDPANPNLSQPFGAGFVRAN